MWDYNGYPENALLEKKFANLREHGMNAFCGALPAVYKVEKGEIKVDFSTADRVAPLIKKYGFKKWMFDNMAYIDIARQAKTDIWSEEHLRLFKSLLAQFKLKAEQEGWPEMVWVVEEPGEMEGDGGTGISTHRDLMNFAKALGEAGVSSNIAWSSHGKSKTDNTDILPLATYNSCLAPVTVCEEVITKLNALKKPLFLYDCGQNRYAFGVLVKQKNALGNSQFWYGAANYLSPVKEYASASCSVMDGNNIIDTYEWEQMREGVYDYRYMWTLEQAIVNYKDQNSPEAAAGKKALENIMKLEFKSYDGEIMGYDVEFMSPAMVNYKGAALDTMRAELVKCILALKK